MDFRNAGKNNLTKLLGDLNGIGVLVVDDDETTCNAIALVLEDEGYAVLQAHNGAQALAILRSVNTPLVVLLDWMMPVLDGLAVLSTVARDPARLGQHTYVFMSAAFPAGLKQLATLSTVMDVAVLIKPFTMALLLDKVQEAASHLRSGKQSASQSRDEDGYAG